jgi:RHH-type rel operon transcriptional repressor/antitoxin RelB
MYTVTHKTAQTMASTTFSVRVDSTVKKRLEKLAKSTGRSRSFLAAEALSEYLEVNEWQFTGIRKAMASLDRGEGAAHGDVKGWVESWGSGNERAAPKRSR